MRKVYILLSMFFVIFSSCIDDKSDLGTNKVSRIRFEKEFQSEAYREDRWNVFKLACPEVIQENEEKPLSYKWDVNYKTVSTERDLEFLCEELTPADMESFTCRLTVSNEDGSASMNFKLVVTSPYEEGVLVMSKVGEESMISFKREDKEGEHFQLDAYKLNNPEFPLGAEPKDVLQHGQYLYVGTENPMRLLKVNSKTMEAVSMLPYPADHIDFMVKPIYSTIYCFDRGRELELDGSQDSFMNAFQQVVDMMYPGIELANNGLWTKEGTLLTYNNTDGMLFKGDYGPEELFEGQFTGKKLLDILACKDSEEQLIIVQGTGKDPDIVHVNADLPKCFSEVSTAGTGITDKSVFTSSLKYSRLYYSVGNEIFVYDYSTDGGFPKKSTYTVGKAGDIVKGIVLTSDDGKLYVAWESASGGEMKGNVSCFVLLGDDEPWEETGIAGDIVRMIYKH